MPKPKRRRFEIRRKQNALEGRRAVNRKQERVFQTKVQTLLGKIRPRLEKRPMNVLFVCSQGMATSGLMRAGFKELVEKLGLQRYFDISSSRSTFSDAFSLKKVDFIVFLPKNINLGWVASNWARVSPKSHAEIVPISLLPNRGIVDTACYQNLLVDLLEREASKHMSE